MKMISSTSMTSTIGVTLISAMTGLRRCRRLPATAAAPEFMAMAIPLPLLVDLPRQDSGELVGETLEPLRLLVHIGNELVIENGRRYGGNEPDGGREQSLRNAGSDHRERRRLLAGDGAKAGHDAPYRAEQADEGARRANGRQHQQPALEPGDLALDGHVHHLLDARLKPRERARMPLQAALPFAHRGNEQGR